MEFEKQTLCCFSFWLNGPETASMFGTSFCNICPPLVWRLPILIWAISTLLGSLITFSSSVMFWFLYLEHWGIILIVLQSSFGVYISILSYLGKFEDASNEDLDVPWYVKVYWLFYTIAIPVAFLITIFYCAIQAGIFFRVLVPLAEDSDYSVNARKNADLNFEPQSSDFNQTLNSNIIYKDNNSLDDNNVDNVINVFDIRYTKTRLSSTLSLKSEDNDSSISNETDKSGTKNDISKNDTDVNNSSIFNKTRKTNGDNNDIFVNIVHNVSTTEIIFKTNNTEDQTDTTYINTKALVELFNATQDAKTTATTETTITTVTPTRSPIQSTRNPKRIFLKPEKFGEIGLIPCTKYTMPRKLGKDKGEYGKPNNVVSTEHGSVHLLYSTTSLYTYATKKDVNIFEKKVKAYSNTAPVDDNRFSEEMDESLNWPMDPFSFRRKKSILQKYDSPIDEDQLPNKNNDEFPQYLMASNDTEPTPEPKGGTVKTPWREFVYYVNSIVMFIELAFAGHPLRLLHIYQPVLFVLVYELFTYIYYLLGGVGVEGKSYIYLPLNWENFGKASALASVVLVYVVLAHLLVVSLASLRDLLGKRLCGRPAITSWDISKMSNKSV